jgi:tRNA (cmo5U34)-methyltransferase
MSSFDDSRWSESGFAQDYLDQADGYLPERRILIAIAQSLYRRLARSRKPRRILDLGCGDGLMAQALLEIDESAEVMLVDGSQEMLNAAAKRLAVFEKVHRVNTSFQNLLAQDPLQDSYSFVLSSLAIHHLTMAEKKALFEYIHSHLDPGGFFLNIDVVLSPTNDLEEWYLALWREWINSHVANWQKASFLGVPQRYKDNVDNTPDPLLPQLRALEEIGFRSVDCFYKYGIFAMFGGGKAE